MKFRMIKLEGWELQKWVLKMNGETFHVGNIFNVQEIFETPV
jgi:hypothetical protein